jgi:hypothetical protein
MVNAPLARKDGASAMVTDPDPSNTPPLPNLPTLVVVADPLATPWLAWPELSMTSPAVPDQEASSM